MREQSIEKYLVDRVTELGGFTIKLDPKGNKGIPDRLVCLPDRVIFVEVKRPTGGVIAQLQHWWRARILDLRLAHAVARTKEEVDEVLS